MILCPQTTETQDLKCQRDISSENLGFVVKQVDCPVEAVRRSAHKRVPPPDKGCRIQR